MGGDKSIPVQDDTQNVLVEEGYQNGTHTQIQFRRTLETCDPHDVTITVSPKQKCFIFIIVFVMKVFYRLRDVRIYFKYPPLYTNTVIVIIFFL